MMLAKGTFSGEFDFTLKDFFSEQVLVGISI